MDDRALQHRYREEQRATLSRHSEVLEKILDRMETSERPQQLFQRIVGSQSSAVSEDE